MVRRRATEHGLLVWDALKRSDEGDVVLIYVLLAQAAVSRFQWFILHFCSMLNTDSMSAILIFCFCCIDSISSPYRYPFHLIITDSLIFDSIAFLFCVPIHVFSHKGGFSNVSGFGVPVQPNCGWFNHLLMDNLYHIRLDIQELEDYRNQSFYLFINQFISCIVIFVYFV